MGNAALSIIFRVLASRPLNRLTLFGIRDGVKRFGDVVLPREALEGLDLFFFRDLTGNVDYDGDGTPDSFRLAVTNAWFDQRITGVELSIDGRRVPPGEMVLRWPGGETRAADVTALEFAPGVAMELIAVGRALGEGLHLLELTIGMELASQVIPVLPVLMRGDVGDFPIRPDCFASLPDWPPGPLEPGIAHVVPHIHYDVEWVKTRETFERIGEGNLREALRLMEADPEMTFVVDQVPHLEPFAARNPDEFESLVALEREGRVEHVNGMYSEPDVNLVSGESLVRQSVAWQRYAQGVFGAPSRTGWLIDSFGMSAQLPQIFAKSGTEFFCYSRARVPEGAASEFLWEGLDGTRILAHNMLKMYNVGHPVPTDRRRALRKMLKNYRFLRSRSVSGNVFYPGGVDHGRPQKEYGEMARAWNDEVDSVKFQFSLPSRFFGSLPRESLRVLKGEFQRELWGTYSARIELKKLNRSCEFTLLDAGKLAAVASLAGASFPRARIDEGWRAVMDNQFHDQIAGCCTDDVASGMKRRFEDALALADGVMVESARALMATPHQSAPGRVACRVLVFNPLAHQVSSWVDLDIDLPPGWEGLRVLDGDRELPFQVVDSTVYGDGSLKRVRAGFVPELPPLGYRVFELEPADRGEEKPEVENPVWLDGSAIENGLLRVELDPGSGLLETATLADGTVFDLRGGNRLTLERDFGNLYSAMALGTTYVHRRRVRSVRAVEDGPLRGTIEVEGRVGRSDFKQRVSLVAGSPRIDLDTEVYFRDTSHRLRLRFPTDLAGGTWTHEIPYGCLERPGHELPAQNLVDLGTAGRGLTLINHGIPGNKCDRRGTVFLTLLRSTDRIYLWEAGPDALELGRHVFRYALYPHGGDWRRAGSVAQAYARNDPPRAFVFPAPALEGPLPREFSALESADANVQVSVFERARNGALLVRLWETSGESTEAVLKPGFPVSRVMKTDLLERESEELEFSGGHVKVPMGGYEIATLVLIV